jgi:hypothetical protein
MHSANRINLPTYKAPSFKSQIPNSRKEKEKAVLACCMLLEI